MIILQTHAATMGFAEMIKLINDYGVMPVMLVICYFLYKMYQKSEAKLTECVDARLADVKEHSDDSKALLQASIQATTETKNAIHQMTELCKEIKEMVVQRQK